MPDSEDCSSTPNRNDFDLNVIVSNIQDLFSLLNQIRRIQAATIDLLSLITSEEFVAAHEGVIAHGLQEVGRREKALKAALQDVGPNATKTIK